MSRRSPRIVLALIAVCCLCQPFTHSIKAQVTLATAADLTTIGGSQPQAGLVRGADGALYGTTAGGGAENCGIVYRLTTDGTLSLVHSFTRSQGCYPVGDLALGPDGSLYGVTYYGGESESPFPGLGTVFKVLPNGTGLGTFTRLHSFLGATGGSNPYAGLIFAPNGLLYGSTTTGSGGIFTIDPQLPEPDNFAIVAPSAVASQAALTLGSDGFLHGTWIGPDRAGTIFRMDLNGALETLYSFPFVPNFPNATLCPEGATPIGELVEAADGQFYGTTSSCGPAPGDIGTIFRITPAGELTTLHVFSEGISPGVYPGGAAPWGGMTLGADGNLYGATTAGGDFSNGILYRVTRGETPSFEILRSFTGADGQGPQEGRLLELSPGVFYGTSSGSGQVFKLSLVNRTPVAHDEQLATTEDQTVTSMLDADDIDNDPLTFAIVTNGTLGAAVVTNVSTGAFTYTPNANVSGTDTFTFKANDGTLDSNVATVTVTISPGNHPPVATSSSFTTAEDTTFTGTLAATDLEGTPLAFSLVTEGIKGRVAITNPSTGAFSYTPFINSNGADSFTFQASDGTSDSNVATVTVAIATIDDVPVAHSQSLFVLEDSAKPIILAGSDADGDTLTYTVLSGPSHGTLSGTPPYLTYAPHLNYNGPDVFTFKVNGTGIDSNSAAINLTITPTLWTTEGPEGGGGGLVTNDPTNPNVVYAVGAGSLFKSTDAGANWNASSKGLEAVAAINAIVVDPLTSTTVYAGTNGGGSLFRSIDGGASWSPRRNGLPVGSVNDVAIDPKTPHILYAGHVSSGMFKSTDGGATWVASNTGLTNVQVFALAIDPETPSTLYAGTFSGGVFKSTDSGTTWAAVNGGLTNLSILDLWIDVATPTILYAAANGGGLFKSTNAGASWTSAGFNSAYVTSIVTDAGSSNIVYASTFQGGVFKSTNGGATWVAVNGGLTDLRVAGLTTHTSTPATLFASAAAGLFKTIDGAASWAPVNHGFTGVSTRSLEFDSATTASLYAGTSSNPIFKNTNLAGTWVAGNGLIDRTGQAMASDPAVPPVLYVGTNQGVFKTTDGGATWAASGLSAASIRALAVDPLTPANVYVGTLSAGVMKSTNGGASWIASNSGLTNLGIGALAVDPLAPSTLYAGTFGGGIFKSTNDGTSWTATSSSLDVRVLAIDSVTTSTVYAGTSAGAFKSLDGGATWNPINIGLTNLFVIALAIDGGQPATIYAGTTGGVFRTTNAGAKWSALPLDGLPSSNITALKVGPDSTGEVYVGTQGGGVFVLRQAPNDAPIADDQSVSTTENSAGVAVALSGSDADGDALTFAIANGPVHGTLTGSAPNPVYTPAPNYNGPDSFTFTASDGTDVSNVATVSITVAPSSVPPLALTLTTPNGGEKVFANIPATIRWTGGAGATSFDVELSRNSGGVFTPIPACTNLPGTATSCTWTPTGTGSTTARTRVTARNNNGTAADGSDADFTISTAAPSVTVTRPNTALSLVIGSADSIRWNHNLGLQSLMRVELSRDGGASWEVLAASFQNTGATSSIFPWVITGPVSSAALVRVTWLDGPRSDVSNVVFSIVRPTITVTAPNTAVALTLGTPRTITWTHNMPSGQLVNLDVSRDSGTTWNSIASGVANATATTGTFDWVVTGPATSTARIRVSSASDAAANDASNVDFSIVTPSIAVTAPNTAVTWRAGNTQTLRFTHNLGTGQPVAFDVSRDGGSTWSPIVSLTTTTSNAVTYAWVVSGPPTPLGRIRARWISDPSVFDTSDVNFAIISRITVTAPNTAVTWGAGSTRQITWTHNLGLAETVNIDVSPDGGATWVSVAAGVANATATSGGFAALMPGSVTTQALVRVSQTTDPTSFDTSDVQFTLAAPVITVTAPNTNVNWTIGSTRSISWSHNLGTAEAVEVALSRDNGVSWAPLTSALANTGNTTGTFSWVVSGPATSTARIRVKWMRNGAIEDVSNVPFRIQ